MLSVVGTMFYSCPEIVKNEPYNDKADIWALGCVLYEICCLEPPFCTSNMLALATKITQSDYDQDKLTVYSSLVATVVQNCLIVDPLRRPDVVGVAGLVAEKILTYTDLVRYKCNSLEKKLEKEKNKTHRMLCSKQDGRVASTSLSSYQSQISKVSNETEVDSGVTSGQASGAGYFLQPHSFDSKSVSDGGGSDMRGNRINSDHIRSSSITVLSPTSSRKNSDSGIDQSAGSSASSRGKLVPTQPVNINKNQSQAGNNQVIK